MNTYTQLTEQERYQIYALKQAAHNSNDLPLLHCRQP